MRSMARSDKATRAAGEGASDGLRSGRRWPVVAAALSGGDGTARAAVLQRRVPVARCGAGGSVVADAGGAGD